MTDVVTGLVTGAAAIATVTLAALIATGTIAGIALLGATGIVVFACGFTVGGLVVGLHVHRAHRGEIERHDQRAEWWRGSAGRQADRLYRLERIIRKGQP